MKKFLAAALALCMTSAALTSCGDSNSSSAADSNSAAANSQASDSSAADTESVSDKLLAEYPASTEKIDVKNIYNDTVDKQDFHSYTVISGSGKIKSNNDMINLNKEETIYIPNGVEYRIEGELELLKSYV